MYVNFSYAAQKQISPQTIINLQLISQNRFEDLSEILKNNLNTDDLSDLEQKGYITHIRAKNKAQTVYNTVRLSDKGKELLENLQIPEIDESDLIIAEWLKAKYIEADKSIGNFKKTKMYIALFRVNTGIARNNLARLCNAFLEDSENFEWSKKLEFLFFKPSNPYEKFDIEQSRLYQYYKSKQDYFINNVFEDESTHIK